MGCCSSATMPPMRCLRPMAASGCRRRIPPPHCLRHRRRRGDGADCRSLHAPALLPRYSRLLIDPNRGADDPTLIMQISDGAVVPGNATIDETERTARIARYYEPYHAAIGASVDAALAAGKPPILALGAQFYFGLEGRAAPLARRGVVGQGPEIGVPLLDAFQAIPDVVAGDNVPYSGQLYGDTLFRHGTSRGLAHVLIEVRQDLILMTPEGQAGWGDRLAEVLRTSCKTRSSQPSSIACSILVPTPTHRRLWISWKTSPSPLKRRAARDLTRSDRWPCPNGRPRWSASSSAVTP